MSQQRWAAFTTAGCQARQRYREYRIEDYAELRSWGLTRREAAERLGVTVRTADRYQAAIRAAS